MYEHVSGTLERIAGELAVVDVGGVGYRLRVPASTAATLRVGAAVKLLVSHRFQNDLFHLYGFATREEREIFERVCAVTGVGPAIGLSILSALPIDRFRDVVLRVGRRGQRDRRSTDQSHDPSFRCGLSRAAPRRRGRELGATAG